jgi:hypothetical protein
MLHVAPGAQFSKGVRPATSEPIPATKRKDKQIFQN